MSEKKVNRKERARRIVALALAGIMILSVLMAAVLSQVW